MAAFSARPVRICGADPLAFLPVSAAEKLSGQVGGFSVVLTLSVQACCSVLWSLGYPFLNASFPLVIGNFNTVIHLWLIGLALSVFRGERIVRDFPYDPKLHLPRYRLSIALQKISQ